MDNEDLYRRIEDSFYSMNEYLLSLEKDNFAEKDADPSEWRELLADPNEADSIIESENVRKEARRLNGLSMGGLVDEAFFRVMVQDDGKKDG